MKNHLIGMRTFKTALSVWITLVLFYFMNERTPMIAALAAVVVLKESPKSSLTSGKHRVMGNFLGALTALMLIVVKQLVQHDVLVELFGAPFAVIFMIVACNKLNYKTGTIGGIAAFFMTYFSAPDIQPILYAANRLIDTLIGSLIAICINYLVDKEVMVQWKNRLLKK